MRRVLILLAAWMPAPLWAATTGAATTGASSDPLGMRAVMQMVLGLVLVVGLILALAWLARKVRLLPGMRGNMRVISVLPLGTREKLVLVQVGGIQFLLGVAGQQVNLIERFDTPVIEPDSGHAASGAFAEKLKEYMDRRGEPKR